MKNLTSFFVIDSYNGGVEEGSEDENQVNKILVEKDFHCSGKGKNFDLVLRAKDLSKLVSVTNFECTGPMSCTAPIKCGGVFVSMKKPKVKEYTKKFNDVLEKEKFDCLVKENSLSGFFFETDKDTKQGGVCLDAPLEGKWIHLKFIAPHSEDNIDIERIGIFGYRGKINSYKKRNNVSEKLTILRRDPKVRLCSFKQGWWIINKYYTNFPILALILPEKISEGNKKKEIEEFRKIMMKHMGKFAFYYGRRGDQHTSKYLKFQVLKTPVNRKCILITDELLYECKRGQDVNEFINLYINKKLRCTVRMSQKETEDKRNVIFKVLMQITALNKDEMMKGKENFVLVYNHRESYVYEYAALVTVLQDEIKKKYQFCSCNLAENDLNDKHFSLGINYFKGTEKVSGNSKTSILDCYNFIKKIIPEIDEKTIKKAQECKKYIDKYAIILGKRGLINGHIKDVGESFKEIEKAKEIIRKVDGLRENLFKKEFSKFDEVLELVDSKVVIDLRKKSEKKHLKRVKMPHTMEEFGELFKTKNKLVIVYFFTQWCGPCLYISPLYANMSEEFKDVLFIQVDCDEIKGISQKFGVRNFPTFKFVKNQKIVNELYGHNPEKLKEIIKKNKL